MIKFVLTVAGLVMLYSFPVLLYALAGGVIVVLLQEMLKKRDNKPDDKHPPATA